MEQSEICSGNQIISHQRSRIKSWCFYTAVAVVYLAILSPSIVPLYFYFTSEKAIPRNFTERTQNISGLDAVVGNASHCNKPLIPHALPNTSITICVPACSWSIFTSEENYRINTAVYTACVIAITSLIVTLLTWFKVPHLWHFPHFIIVIMLTESTIIVSLVAVGILLGHDAFCSSKYLQEASEKPTGFCVFEGALIQYLAGSVSLWFVAYNVVIAKGLIFENIRPNERSKRPFVISAASCWILPVIPVIIVLSSNDGYSSNGTYCFPKSPEMIFYTAVLPENVIYAVGVSFLFVIVWKLLKERQTTISASRHQNEIRKSKMGNVVKRLSLLMIFYSATTYLTYGSVAYQLNKAEALETSLEWYLKCLNFQAKCPTDYRKYVFYLPLVLNYIAAGVFPLATVLFLAANEKTRRFWKTPYYQLRGFMSRHTLTTTSSSRLVNANSPDIIDRQLDRKT